MKTASILWAALPRVEVLIFLIGAILLFAAQSPLITDDLVQFDRTQFQKMNLPV